MASTIGLKVANGEFYSILGENLHAKKRLVLTTAHDMQQSVQIDLYKSHTQTMADAFYIGSLVVDHITPRPKGDPSIELIVSSTPDGDINAEAKDLDASTQGIHQSLHVSLASLEEDNNEYVLLDFDLDSPGEIPTGLYEDEPKPRSREGRKFPWLALVCGILLISALGLALWLFVFRDRQPTLGSGRGEAFGSQTQTQGTETPASPPPASAPPAPAAPPVPVIQAPASPPPAAAPAVRTRPVPPVASYRVPASIPREGVLYQVRYGDTLWDIAEAFYRNPWLYPRIAMFNNIRNPDLIISGSTIRIPPRN
ncbi:MAG: LysM peptidoglycan-binding domain-containing protein [Treponema sp.]|nr:LysM peptidoglycan-binding domain-containing protein [Treponema sp.]